jgi:hypothetical protein
MAQTFPATSPAGQPERIEYTIKVFTKKERENNINFPEIILPGST